MTKNEIQTLIIALGNQTQPKSITPTMMAEQQSYSCKNVITTPKPITMKEQKHSLSPQGWAGILLATIISISYLIGLITPPPGELQPTQLEGMEWMVKLVLIFFAWDAVKSGLNAIFEHGKTKLTISQQSKQTKPETHEKD